MRHLQVYPTYCSVRLHPDSLPLVVRFYTREVFREHQPLQPGRLHVTVISSPLALPDPLQYMRVVRPNAVHTAEIGEPKELGDYTVLTLIAPTIVERHETLKALGLEHSFPEFIPHMSFAKCRLTPALRAALAEMRGRVVKLYRERISTGPYDPGLPL